MKVEDLLRCAALGLVVCAAVVVPALTMGGKAVADPIRIGDPAPELAVGLWIRGTPLSLHDGRGAAIVIVFWGTYCPPCRDAMPLLSDIQERYAGDGVRVVCVGHESREVTEAYVNGAKPPLKQSFALDDHWATSKQYLEGLQVLGIPYAVIVGGDGAVAWHGNPVTDRIEEALRRTIGAPGGA